MSAKYSSDSTPNYMSGTWRKDIILVTQSSIAIDNSQSSKTFEIILVTLIVSLIRFKFRVNFIDLPPGPRSYNKIGEKVMPGIAVVFYLS